MLISLTCGGLNNGCRNGGLKDGCRNGGRRRRLRLLLYCGAGVMAAASYFFPEIAIYLQMLQSTCVKKNVSEPTRVYYRWKSLFRITG